MRQLPEVLESNVVGGRIIRGAARRFGLPEGMPVLVGIVDTSSAMLLIGAQPGRCSTSADRPTSWRFAPTGSPARTGCSPGHWASGKSGCPSARWPPRDRLELGQGPVFPRSRAEGVLEADGEAGALQTRGSEVGGSVRALFGGERTSIEQRQAGFCGLTLATTREEMLAAMIESLATASAARFELLRQNKVRMRKDVVISGGVQNGLDKVLHRDWPGKWDFRVEEEATLRGLSTLEPVEA